MKRYSPYLLSTLFLGIFCSLAIGAEPWRVPEANYRLKINKRKDSPWPTKVAYIKFCPYRIPASSCGFKIVTKKGRTVPHQVLWAKRNEAIKILFDCSSKQTEYYLYFGGAVPKIKQNWKPRAGLILETRERSEGPVSTWKEIKALWGKSKPILGRSLVPNVFLGIHPHGPTSDFMSWFHGYFKVEKAGEYLFATVSDDASVLMVDKKLVVEWPKWHGVKPGRRGEFNGKIKLKAGLHRLDYYNIQNHFGFCVVAAWKSPEMEKLEVIPAKAFPSIAKFAVTNIHEKPGKPVLDYFNWEIVKHAMTKGKSIIKAKFLVTPKRRGYSYKWKFDDGIISYGPSTAHLFLSSGQRTVKLEVRERKRLLTHYQRFVDIQPLWTQRHEWTQQWYDKIKKEITAQDLRKVSIKDLVNFLAIALETDDWHSIAHLGPIAIDKSRKLLPEHAETLLSLNLALQNYKLKKYALAKDFFELLYKEVPEGKISDQIKLHFGGFLIHYYGECDRGLKILNEINLKNLSNSDIRLRTIFLGDAHLAKNDVKRAREFYLSAKIKVNTNELRYSVLKRGRIQGAKDLLRIGETDKAYEILKLIEWEAPMERLNLEIALLMAKIRSTRGENGFALRRCLRSMNAAGADRRLSLLYLQLIEIYVEIKDLNNAKIVFKRLIKDFPYSEASAIAKDRFSRDLENENN